MFSKEDEEEDDDDEDEHGKSVKIMFMYFVPRVIFFFACGYFFMCSPP